MDKTPIASAPQPEQPETGGVVTAELVKQVADRVYAMLLRDLRIEQERRRSLVAYPRPDSKR